MRTFVGLRGALLTSLVLTAGSAWAQQAPASAAAPQAPVVESTAPGAVPPAPEGGQTAVQPAPTAQPAPASQPATAAQPTAEAAPTQTPAAYLLGIARAPESDIDGFLAQPQTLLDANADVGPKMRAQVWRLAASDSRVVPALVELGSRPDLTSAQVATIAGGLRRAVDEAPSASAAYGNYIQETVARSGSARFVAAFERAGRELETAAIGQGAGAGAGGGPGSVGGNGSAGLAGPGSDEPIPVAQSAGTLGRNYGSGGISFTDGGTTRCVVDESPAGDCF